MGMTVFFRHVLCCRLYSMHRSRLPDLVACLVVCERPPGTVCTRRGGLGNSFLTPSGLVSTNPTLHPSRRTRSYWPPLLVSLHAARCMRLAACGSLHVARTTYWCTVQSDGHAHTWTGPWCGAAQDHVRHVGCEAGQSAAPHLCCGIERRSGGQSRTVSWYTAHSLASVF